MQIAIVEQPRVYEHAFAVAFDGLGSRMKRSRRVERGRRDLVDALGLRRIEAELDRRLQHAEERNDGDVERECHDPVESLDDPDTLARDAELFLEFSQRRRDRIRPVRRVDEAARERDLPRIATQVCCSSDEHEGRRRVADEGNDNGGLEHPRFFLRRASSRTANVIGVKRLAWAFDLAALALAVAVKLATPQQAWVEAHYSNGVYPDIDRAVRGVTGSVPFCLGDVLFFGLLAGLAVWAWRRRGAAGGWRAIVAILTRTVAVLCIVFVWFVVSWGYNYSRVPLADKIPVHAERTTPAAVSAYANHVADELTRYAVLTHGERLSDAGMAARVLPTFTPAIRRLGDVATFAPPRIKPTVFQPFMELSGTTGFTDPWTHEVNVDASALPFERPALYAHEWGHVAGFADESEANFISVVACTNASDPLVAYSGWLLIWFNLPRDVHVTHRLGRQASADVRAIVARFRRLMNPQIARTQALFYNQYLHANHVKAGSASYRLFVRWLTGADFDRNGLPIVALPRAL